MNETETTSEYMPPEESWSAKDAFLAVGAFVVIAILAVGAYFFYQSTKPPMVIEGSIAPEFTYPTLAGGEASLSDYRGKVVLLNVWNTACIECKREMPLMEIKYRGMKDKPFEILAVSNDRRGATDVQPFVDNLFTEEGRPIELTFPILLDTEDKIGRNYQVVRYPESFILDKEGVVAKIIIGRLTERDFLYMEGLTEGKPQPQADYHQNTTS
ncbi:MAG: TlpA family protein disulfide reductase [Thermoleophilia bacterium]|nr:TlpA family protein disulfide reductase [Thermoleophilia bacterium]